jgi:hypothetical protein
LGVLGTKVFLPPVDKKLRMRRSYEQWLRIALSKQLSSLPDRGAEDGIDDRSLSLRGRGNRLVHSRVLRRFE